jgi:putative flavoprotein involved in K+ transport
MTNELQLIGPTTPFEVIVIGAGQAGLAIAWHLRQQGRRFLVLDARPEIGHVWRSRWDSLQLFTPTEYDSLPGLSFPGEAGSYPTKDDVAEYLTSYVAAFDLPVQLNSPVTELARAGDDFEVRTTQRSYFAHQVVVATGPFQTAFVPEIAGGLDASVHQLHSSQYRNPAELPAGPVLVVGAGNSGLQIAEELSASRQVDVAVGSRPRTVPRRLLGRNLFWWLIRLGLLTKPAESALARRFRSGGDLVIGTHRRALKKVRFRSRLVAASDGAVRFTDQSTLDVRVVIWATGYRPDYSWITVPDVVSDGRILHERGVSPIRGIYVLGLPWLYTRGSALLGFVDADAEHLAHRIASTERARAGSAAS